MNIRGYRELTPGEVQLINDIKEKANEVGAMVAVLRSYVVNTPFAVPPGVDPNKFDQRWISLGATHLQEGFMALVRGVARPEGF